MFGPPVGVFGQVRACSVHHQYSSRVSPFQAKTGTPAGASGVPVGPTAMAAAAWSWVEKMLQEAQRTSAPRATRVSMSTAVCTVMCSEPVTRAAGQRLRGRVLLADRHQAGHLVLGEGDLLAAEHREGKVGDLEVLVLGDRRHGGSAPRKGRGWAGWLCGAGHTNARGSRLSPSEALSPSAGPLARADRPPSAATSGTRTNLHRTAVSAPAHGGRCAHGTAGLAGSSGSGRRARRRPEAARRPRAARRPQGARHRPPAGTGRGWCPPTRRPRCRCPAPGR